MASAGSLDLAAQATTDLVIANPGTAVPMAVDFELVGTEARRVVIRYADETVGEVDVTPGIPRKVVLHFVAQPGVSRLRLGSGDKGSASPYRLQALNYGPAP